MVLDPLDVSAYVSVRWDLPSGSSEPSSKEGPLGSLGQAVAWDRSPAH